MQTADTAIGASGGSQAMSEGSSLEKILARRRQQVAGDRAATDLPATLISESGISSRADIDQLTQGGNSGFLIGESLLRAADPAALLRSLRGVPLRELRHV